MMLLLGKFKIELIMVAAVVAIVAVIYIAGRSAGYESAVVKQKESDDAARKRIQDVVPATPDGVIVSLRKGTF